MKKIGQMIKKYGNTVLLFLAVFSASEIGNKGCMFIFHFDTFFPKFLYCTCTD